ncbi:hypothetical protein J6590_094199 [Homalodisca vitripennis]|nr:hypothetical protein J6590_094199 [Homalodisca vitripennis]
MGNFQRDYSPTSFISLLHRSSSTDPLSGDFLTWQSDHKLHSVTHQDYDVTGDLLPGSVDSCERLKSLPFIRLNSLRLLADAYVYIQNSIRVHSIKLIQKLSIYQISLLKLPIEVKPVNNYNIKEF